MALGELLALLGFLTVVGTNNRASIKQLFLGLNVKST